MNSWKSDISAGAPHGHTFPLSHAGWRILDAITRREEHGQILGWHGLPEDIDDRDPHEL